MGRTCVLFSQSAFSPAMEPALEGLIRRAVVEFDAAIFLCGGYGAFDSCAARIVDRLQEEYPRIRLQLLLAHMPAQQTDGAMGVRLPDHLEQLPPRYALARRNSWLLEQGDILIVHIDTPRGAIYRHCCAARAQGKPVLNLGSAEI